VNRQQFKESVDELFVHIFKGLENKEVNDKYPYRDASDFLGVLFNRKFDNF